MFTVLQRYDFESNSQLHTFFALICRGVYRIAKVRFWKQFTTTTETYDNWTPEGCLPYCKGTILKAIHNLPTYQTLLPGGVFRIAKVQFWKQFTTPAYLGFSARPVFTVLQRYNFGTKSQPFAYIITAIFLFIDYEKDQRHHYPLHRDYAPKSCPSFDVHKNL